MFCVRYESGYCGQFTRPVVLLRRVTALYTQALVRSHLACPWPYALRREHILWPYGSLRGPTNTGLLSLRKKEKTLHLCCFTITIVYFIT